MRPWFLILSLLTTSSLVAQTCNLGITVTCDGNHCTMVTTNNGNSACSGGFFTGIETPGATSSITGFQSGLPEPECFDSSIAPGATVPFAFCFGEATLAPGASLTGTANVTGAATQPVLAFTGVNDTFVYAFANALQPTCTPIVSAPSAAQSGTSYAIVWTPVSNPQTQFQIDESTSADFSSNVTTTSASGITASFVHTVTANTTYYYRVRAINCGANPNSATVSTVVQATTQIPSTAKSADIVTAFGSTQPVTAQLFIPGPSGKAGSLDTGFAASTDKPYLSVTPSSGTIPPGGTTVTVTANPTNLPPGANTGTVTVTSAGSTVASPSLSVSLVTPVAPGSKSLPPNNALIIPVVTHVNGATSPFFSDVRLTNASPARITYQLTFTPTRTDGTTSSKVTNVTVDSQQTLALNDIAKDFFGYGASGNPNDTGFGSLEIRPLNTSSLLTFAASRTYASTASGTFGQFIAAIPFSKFIGNTAPPIPTQLPTHQTLLSLQQIAQSAKFRTNLGLTEGSGSPASGRIRVFDDAGALLKSIPYSLQAGEQQQLNQFLAVNGLTLDDGRIEITVDSPTGAVAAYASVLDNLTADPLAVMPAIPATISATRYIVPGIADLNNGAANFHSDLRIFNGGSSLAHVTLTYYPQGNPADAKSTTADIGPGVVRAFDNVLPSLFGVTNSGGSVLITTLTPSSLVATARTYSIDAKGGTFGQFIPGVTPAEGIGLGDRPLQVLQLEQSQHFRSNLGLAELTGTAAKVRVSLFLPDSKVTPSTEVDLAPNEFRQLSSVIAGMNPGNTYNARITVEVISGTGRVTAYGSVVDNDTQDPTYVPAQ
jgi:hypothetical protein